MATAEETLDAVREALRQVGFAEVVVQSSPAQCVQALIAKQTDRDWRDIFLAVLAGGHSVHVAKSAADLGALILAEQRTRGVE